MSALHVAAECGHNIVCDALLAHKAFVNSKSRVGLTPLHLAALKGHTDLVRSLIATHHAAIDSLTLRKETPLHLAAGAGQLQVCGLLIELGADLEATDELGQKVIHLAAQQNHSEVIKLFLKHQPSLVSTANKVCVAHFVFLSFQCASTNVDNISLFVPSSSFVYVLSQLCSCWWLLLLFLLVLSSGGFATRFKWNFTSYIMRIFWEFYVHKGIFSTFGENFEILR